MFGVSIAAAFCLVMLASSVARRALLSKIMSGLVHAERTQGHSDFPGDSRSRANGPLYRNFNNFGGDV
jgi:hypothetical protein